MTAATTIAQQVTSLGVISKGLFQIDDEAIRVHTKRGRKVTNVDIRYAPGTDTYTVTTAVFTSINIADMVIKTLELVHADQLGDIFDRLGITRINTRRS